MGYKYSREYKKYTKIVAQYVKPKGVKDLRYHGVLMDYERYRNEQISKSFTIFKFVLLLLLFFSIFSKLNSGTLKTFGSLINHLGTCPVIKMDWILKVTTVKAELPSWLVFLEVLGDSFHTVVQLLLVLIAGAINLFTFSVWIVGWLVL